MTKKLKEICSYAEEDKSNNEDHSENLTQPNSPKEVSVIRKVYCKNYKHILCTLLFGCSYSIKAQQYKANKKDINLRLKKR